tara:strand:- start:890 stop:1537 length:648 start_codon:yes stop_codon:yes gene_type:complete
MKKKYIGMAWPSDGLNDSEYWKNLPKNFELLISRYKVSGSLKPNILKKEANLKRISRSLETLNLKKINILILCDFASSVLNKDYIEKSQLYFKKKFNLPCINIVSSTLNFIENRKKNISIISPYNKIITKKFLSLIKDKSRISSISNLSFNSEEEIDDTKSFLKKLKLNTYKNDLLFIGGGITISTFSKFYKNKYGYNVYSSPIILIDDVVTLLR